MRLNGSPVDPTSVSYVGSPSGAILGSVTNPVGRLQVSSQQTPSIVSLPNTGGVLEGEFQSEVGKIMSIVSPSGGGGSAASRPKIFHVDDYGADPTGTFSSDAALTAARTAMGSGPGWIVFGVGKYIINSAGLNVANGMSLGLNQGAVGQGSCLTEVQYNGNDAMFECRNSAWTFNTGSLGGGGVHGLWITGWANTNTNVYGVRYGDIGRMTMSDMSIVGFNKAGDIGVFGDNQVAWSERANLDVSVEQCTTAYLFQGCMANSLQSYGTSFDYSVYRLSFVVQPNQDAFVLRSRSGGLATTMNGVELSLTGNCITAASGGTNTGSLFTVGADNNDYAAFSGELHVNVETSGTAGGVAHKDFNVGAGPYWSVNAKVTATGAINLIPFSGTNFKQGSASPRTFSFSGLLKKSAALGTTGNNQAFQALQMASQANGVYGKAPSNAVQSVYVKAATAGTFRLNYGGTYTSAIPYNATAAQVLSALNGISALNGNVTVVQSQSRFVNGAYANEKAFGITFVNGLSATAVPTFTADVSSLTGTVEVVVRNTGSSNQIITLTLESGNVIKVEDVPGTYRLAFNLGNLTDNVGVDRDSPFGTTVDLWIKQPSSGGNIIIEGPWFAPVAAQASTYSFQWYDGIDPVLSTAPDSYDLLRFSSFNFNTWVGQHVTRKLVVDPPATSSSSGVKGQIAYDSSYRYDCVALNTWKRSALSTW